MEDPLLVENPNREDEEEEYEGDCNFHSLTILLCICLLTFGSYWVYDTPGAIETQLEAWFGPSYTHSDNALLYAVYSWPNTVLALFGGMLIDKMSVRVGALLFTFLILLGQVTFALGIQYKYFAVAVVGRFIFGLGGESLTVAQNTFTVRWFSGPNMAGVFGLVVAFSRCGSAVNFLVTPIIVKTKDVPFSVWMGVGLCGMSMCFGILAFVLDKFGGRKLARRKQHIAASGVVPEADVQSEQTSCRQVLDFPVHAWLLFFVCLFFYVSIFTFNTVASQILQHTGRKFSPTTASSFLAIPNLICIFLNPVVGSLVDKKGRGLSMIFVASLMFICAHVAFLANANGWTDIHPAIILCWIGVAFALGSSTMWPILALCLPDRILGTGYGMMTAVQNMGLALFPTLIGIITDNPKIKGTSWQYTAPIFVFITTASIAAVLVLVLIGTDRNSNGARMNSSAAERKLAAASGMDNVVVNTR